VWGSFIFLSGFQPTPTQFAFVVIMVVLEAAAIGAASYGLYRGGDAAVRRGKESIKEYKREQKRSEQRSELSQKLKARNERVAQLASIRRGGASTTAGTPSLSSSVPISAFNACTTNPCSTSSISGSSSVDERHRNVMEKLRSSRREEASKATSAGKFNPFKKK
jgi:hypothetical protein